MNLLRLPVSILLLAIQSAILAIGQIWANKTRSVLTTIGIVIGVASVTAVIAALTGLRTSVLTEFETLGTDKMFVFPYYNGPSKRNPRGYFFGLHTADFDGILEHCPDVKAFTREIELSVTASNGTKSEDNVPLLGVEPSWHEVENRPVIIGRTFSLIDNQHARAVCLINARLRDRLGLPVDPTGEPVLLGSRRFRIVGVLENRTESSMFGGGGSGMEAFIPFNTGARSRERQGIFVIATCRAPDVAEEARAEMTFFLRHKRKIPLDSPADFRIEIVEQFLQEFSKVSATITLIATCVVGISLLVGGVGIMNIMLVSVSERTREIGLRKAVGARPSAILFQFLIEATMLCLMGGFIGLLGGEAILLALKHIPDSQLDKAYVPAWAVALAFGFAAGVGLIFGMFPAIKAARLDPIEALRHE
ncbi:MAG TPA: ABC transporter permease [Tepidisphaeraceae bacterium]|nr:ABC transporter permease [Tepidisphaeraceae bacterium]